MAEITVGLLHPGEMGAAVGACLVAQGRPVLWASDGRSADSRDRARRAGLTDAGSVAALLAQSQVVLSICPPHAALATAVSAADFTGIYVDANAISAATSRRVAAEVSHASYVDGGIVGGPPQRDTGPRLYLSGSDAGQVRDLFSGTAVDARVIDGGVGAASSLKMAYAAWTKGSAALLLSARVLARAEGVEEELVAEWGDSIPELAGRYAHAQESAAAKGWRWVGEMEEIAAAMEAVSLPDGFHQAAAEVYRDFRRPAHGLPGRSS